MCGSVLVVRRAPTGGKLVESVEQSTRLVFLRIDSGQTEQTPTVVSRVDDLGSDADGISGQIGLQGDFFDVEAEFIESFDSFGNLPRVRRRHLLPRGQLRPQSLVTGDEAIGVFDGVDARVQPSARLKVEQFAGDVDSGNVDVVRPLPRTEIAVDEFTRLGVDKVSRE